MDIRNRIAAKQIFKQWNINSMHEHLDNIMSTHGHFSAIYDYCPKKQCLEKSIFDKDKWNMRLTHYLRKEPIFWLEAHSHGGENLICLRRYNQMLILQIWENEQWQLQKETIEQQFNQLFNLRQIEQAYICHYDDIWWREEDTVNIYRPDYRRTLLQENYLPYLNRNGLQRRLNEDEVYAPVCWKMWIRKKQAWFDLANVTVKPLVQGWAVQLYDMPENFWLRENRFLQQNIKLLSSP